jgi:hypothetical protein
MDMVVEASLNRVSEDFGLPSLVNVLWRPQRTLALRQSAAAVAALLFLVFAIDFVLALALVPSVFESLGKAAALANLGANAKVMAVGIAVIIGALGDVVLIAFMGLLFLVALLVLDGRAGYREIVGSLLIASAPSIIDRVQRILAFFCGFSAHSTDDFFSLGRLFLAGDTSFWLANLTIFDLWTLALVVLGVYKVSGLRFPAALLAALLLWGGMDLLMLRLQLAGGAG